MSERRWMPTSVGEKLWMPVEEHVAEVKRWRETCEEAEAAEEQAKELAEERQIMIEDWYAFKHRAEAAEQRVEKLEDALRVAADDLGKAANQFQSIKLSQAAGHNPQIENNPTIFMEKERRARTALTESEDE